MKKIFKYALLFATALTLSTGFTACDDDDDPKDPTEDMYKDRTYGNQAIDACADVVSKLEAANSTIAGSTLTSEQEAYLRNVLKNLVSNVIVPTYTELADDVEDLEKTLNGLTVNTISQSQINEACDDFKDARENWERSEAFLMGAASDFEIDPTIDSWPLNRSLLLNYFNNGMPPSLASTPWSSSCSAMASRARLPSSKATTPIRTSLV